MSAYQSGKPFEAGIYNATVAGQFDPEVMRYWDGRTWSCPWLADDPYEIVHRARFRVGETQEGIEWRAAPGYRMPSPPQAPGQVVELSRGEEPTKPSNPKDAIGVRKAPMSTVSAAVLAEIGVAMLEGAAKYGRHNYRAVGVRSSAYYDAALRHLFAWWEGEDIDAESGMSHVTKAITSLVVLRDAMMQGKVEDDRAPRAEPFMKRLNALAAEIIDRRAGMPVPPRHYTIADSTR